ncbi:zinc finger protein 395 [Diachasma alloeum]|uniref:zinc finger protein 395 n=1 Tax=Diachasma alloeum TaxID=454923 RepID=UPI000738192C|nr:zinc finger protein 395 [Diachasma alloeum]
MSTGKRLAKRSIIGTRVCAPGMDGKYYSGVIHAVKTPASAASDAGLSLTPSTRYSVRFDAVPGGRPPSPSTEYCDRDLIGPGFGTVNGVRLMPGQKVYLTYRGREIQAEVTMHKEHQDEVEVKIAATNGSEGPVSLTKRIEEVRLLESRKSARLADQKTDFARMADMTSDRKRVTSHSIDVPHVPGSRKRRPSSSNDSERSDNGGWTENNNSNSTSNNNMRQDHGCVRDDERDGCMDDCTAAVALLSLLNSSVSPNNLPSPIPCEPSYGTGGTSNSSSSSSGGSWRSTTPSPGLLSEEGASPSEVSAWPTSGNNFTGRNHAHQGRHERRSPTSIPSGSSYGSTPGSTGTLDETMWFPDDDDMHPKKKSRTKLNREIIVNRRKYTQPTQGYIFEDCGRPNIHPMFQCSWRKCGEVRETVEQMVAHIRNVHNPPIPAEVACTVQEEEFYFDVIKVIEYVSSPPTMSHRDMARPPHEDPEYQKQLALEAEAKVVKVIETPAVRAPQTSLLKIRNEEQSFTLCPSSPTGGTPIKHLKPTTSQQRHIFPPSSGLLAVSAGGKILSSSRRVRGETKKCRKVHGMDRKTEWCKQCRWKKACSRYGD